MTLNTPPEIADVFAEREHVRIAFHHGVERGVERWIARLMLAMLGALLHEAPPAREG